MFGFLKNSAASLPVASSASQDSTPLSWRARLQKGLSRTRVEWQSKLTAVFAGGKIDADVLEALEAFLLASDVGVEATAYLLAELRAAARSTGAATPEALQALLAEALYQLLQPLECAPDLSGCRPYTVLVAGINGAGKTTSIGKLARYFQAQGKTVLLAAGDTFRAAAGEQLAAWGEKNQITVIAQNNGDPAAVVFDAITAAKARGIDVVLADTAGRLPTQLHLMNEISKVRRVIQKADPSAPHETLLVLDATIGQNALMQIKAFDAAIQVSGLIVTKLDGSAKGGVLAAIARQCPKPVRFVGVGEGIDDLRPFDARDFVGALFS